MIYVIATLTIRPGTFDEVMQKVMPCIEATRAEEGCISYDLHRSVTDENVLVFVERWKDRAAIGAHFREPHLVAWRDAAEQLTSERKVEIVHADKVEEF